MYVPVPPPPQKKSCKQGRVTNMSGTRARTIADSNYHYEQYYVLLCTIMRRNGIVFHVRCTATGAKVTVLQGVVEARASQYTRNEQASSCYSGRNRNQHDAMVPLSAHPRPCCGHCNVGKFMPGPDGRAETTKRRVAQPIPKSVVNQRYTMQYRRQAG